MHLVILVNSVKYGKTSSSSMVIGGYRPSVSTSEQHVASASCLRVSLSILLQRQREASSIMIWQHHLLSISIGMMTRQSERMG